jgi:hypothetical protein
LLTVRVQRYSSSSNRTYGAPGRTARRPRFRGRHTDNGRFPGVSGAFLYCGGPVTWALIPRICLSLCGQGGVYQSIWKEGHWDYYYRSWFRCTMRLARNSFSICTQIQPRTR